MKSHILISIEHKDDLDITDHVAARIWSKDGVKHGSVVATLLDSAALREILRIADQCKEVA